MHWHHSALSSRPQVLQSVTQWRPQEKETKYKTLLSAAGVLKVMGVKNKNRKNVIPSWSSSWQCVEVGHSEVKHRRNCKSCPTQVTWKIKFNVRSVCPVCSCVLGVLITTMIMKIITTLWPWHRWLPWWSWLWQPWWPWCQRRPWWPS